jgi:hypothetical protein
MDDDNILMLRIEIDPGHRGAERRVITQKALEQVEDALDRPDAEAWIVKALHGWELKRYVVLLWVDGARRSRVTHRLVRRALRVPFGTGCTVEAKDASRSSMAPEEVSTFEVRVHAYGGNVEGMAGKIVGAVGAVRSGIDWHAPEDGTSGRAYTLSYVLGPDSPTDVAVLEERAREAAPALWEYFDIEGQEASLRVEVPEMDVLDSSKLRRE